VFVQRELADIAAEEHVVGTEGELWGRLHRPPKLATPEFEALLAAHAVVARDLGVDLPKPVHAGGGTDGSLMGAVGLATLDSMGVVGGRAHTSREFLDLESMPERAVIAVILLERLVLGHALRSPQGAVD
jgi:glutamate carboxypeptidase